MSGPYESSALAYLKAGFSPLPVPGKWPPPSGWTGNDGAWASVADVLAWIDSDGDKNVALRLPLSVIGIDVDTYAGKPGAATLRAAIERWGPLPATWISTSRSGMSGIRLFRVPEGLAWPGELPGGGVETIRHGHRYCMAAPSIHPEGRPYRWIMPEGENGTLYGATPLADELPDLPAAWVHGLTAGKEALDLTRANLSDAEARAWLTAADKGFPCSTMLHAVKRGVLDMAGGGSRHEALTRVTARVAHLAQQGHAGVLPAITMIERAFGHTTAGEKRSGEIDRALTGAVRLAAGQGEIEKADPCTLGVFGGQLPNVATPALVAAGRPEPVTGERVSLPTVAAAPTVTSSAPAPAETSPPAGAVTFQAPAPLDVFGGAEPARFEHYLHDPDAAFDEAYADEIAEARSAPAEDVDHALDASRDAPSEDPAYLAALSIEIGQQRARREARKVLDDEEYAKAFRIPPHTATLSDELALPDEPVTYRIDKVLPTGGNVLLTAMYKAGKTSLLNQLARCLADGHPFLGQLPVNPLAPGERAALWNYEVDRGQYRRWLREVDVRNADAISVLNLRGYRMPITVPHVEDWIVRWLSEHNVRVWFVDPFARAFTGVSENDNTEVGRWLDAIDVIKERAGVRELILPAHTGRAEQEEGRERARGATRLDDWADVRWLLNKSEDDQRFFAATGRDVEYEEKLLKWDEKTRSHLIVGGNRAITRTLAVHNAVIAVVLNDPGVSLAGIRRGVRATLGKASNDAIADAVEVAVERGQIRVEKSGQTSHHFLAASAPVDVFA